MGSPNVELLFNVTSNFIFYFNRFGRVNNHMVKSDFLLN